MIPHNNQTRIKFLGKIGTLFRMPRYMFQEGCGEPDVGIFRVPPLREIQVQSLFYPIFLKITSLSQLASPEKLAEKGLYKTWYEVQEEANHSYTEIVCDLGGIGNLWIFRLLDGEYEGRGGIVTMVPGLEDGIRGGGGRFALEPVRNRFERDLRRLAEEAN